jgi:cytochrome P450
MALAELIKHKSLLPALEALHAEMGDVFTLPAPGFKPFVFAGPEAMHFLLVEARHELVWRSETDPVTKLLRRGLLVQDGSQHDYLRRLVSPALHRKKLDGYVEKMVHWTDHICNTWNDIDRYDMLVEMRKIALLVLMDTLFSKEFSNDLDRMMPFIVRMLRYISPGLWLIWEGAPRIGYAKALNEVDDYLYNLIDDRRKSDSHAGDMLDDLLNDSEMTTGLARDQLLTILIAGHDTSTALLSWTLLMLGKHPLVLERARKEVRNVLGSYPPDPGKLEELVYLGQIIKETLRLFPPIHVGNRLTASELEFGGYRIPEGERLMVSIYLTHRTIRLWPDPTRFDPDRFAPGVRHQPYAYLPFGGGPRNCIGAAFAQVEAKAILARILQRFDLALLDHPVHMYMGATLEPHPGVWMRTRKAIGRG